MSASAAACVAEADIRVAAAAPLAERKLMAVVDKHRPKFARRVLDALEAAQERIDTVALSMLIAGGNADDVVAFMERLDFLGTEIRAAADDGVIDLPDAAASTLATTMLDVAEDAASSTQCAYGGPVPKAKAKSGNVTQSQVEEIYKLYKQGVKKTNLQADYGLTSSQLTTIIYKEEVNLFPTEKLSAIWTDYKAGKTTAELQKTFDLTQSQIQMVVSKVKSSSQAIKNAIMSPVEAVVTPAKPVIPKPYPLAKQATWSAEHPSKKPFEQFWLEKKQYHGFTDAEIAWNLQIPEADLAAIFEKGAQQQLSYVAPKPVPYKVPNVKPDAYVPKATPQVPVQTFNFTNITKTAPGEWPIAPDTVRTMGNTYPNVVKDAFRAWESSLTTAERDAIRKYTGSAYENINITVRDSGLGARADAKLIQQGLDKAQQFGTPPPPELVWRGLNNPGAYNFVNKLATGDVIELGGFQSTSISPEFAYNWSHGRVVFEIKPTRGAFVDPFSANGGEKEFLLPHGAKYRVRGQQTIKILKSYGGTVDHTVIQLEMVE